MMKTKGRKNLNPQISIEGDIENFGYRREGDGRVIYIYDGEMSFTAASYIEELAYTETYEDEDGEEHIDMAQYDPSFVTFGKHEVTDVEPLAEHIDEDDDQAKIAFFQEALDANIFLFLIDINKNIIYQLDEGNLEELLDSRYDLTLFAREYDHGYDY